MPQQVYSVVKKPTKREDEFSMLQKAAALAISDDDDDDDDELPPLPTTRPIVYSDIVILPSGSAREVCHTALPLSTHHPFPR